MKKNNKNEKLGIVYTDNVELMARLRKDVSPWLGNGREASLHELALSEINKIVGASKVKADFSSVV